MKNKISFIFAIILLVSVLPETNAQSLLQDGKVPSDLEITLERSSCFLGSCPIYDLVIKSDKTIFFTGTNTKIKGKIKGKITEKKLRDLIIEFETTEFFKLQDNYMSREDGCETFFDDFPMEIISIKINGLYKQVRHNFGCQKQSGNELDKIIILGKKIDEITNSKSWIEPVTQFLIPPKRKS